VVPAIDPQAADYEALAYYCLQRNDIAGVRENIARSIELNPEAANPHLLLAAASLLEKNTSNAEQEIDIALRINKNESGAGLLLAISQFEQKNFDNACMLIENELRNNPGYEVARNMYKRYFIKKK
jgi:Tfp pilus assembly protein PilF